MSDSRAAAGNTVGTVVVLSGGYWPQGIKVVSRSSGGGVGGGVGGGYGGSGLGGGLEMGTEAVH